MLGHMPPRPRQPFTPQVPQGRRRTSAPAITDVLKVGRSFSFEFFPPKTDKAKAQLWESIRRLEPLKPTFVSVTYGAAVPPERAPCSDTAAIAKQTSLDPVAHLTAVNHSVAELRHVIGSYAGVGVRNVLALRGDPPGDPNADWVPHPEGLSHAVQLVELIKASGDFCVGVAAFPELHPRSPDEETDPALRGQVPGGRGLRDHPDLLLRRGLPQAAGQGGQQGCDVPIIAGIMPVTSARVLERTVELGGCKVPAGLLDQLRAASGRGDQAEVRRIGVDYAAVLSQRLLDEGAPGLHFITLNGSRATMEVYERLGLADPRRSPLEAAAGRPSPRRAARFPRTGTRSAGR